MKTLRGRSTLLAQLSHYLQLDLSFFVNGSFWASLQQIVGVSSGLAVSYLFGHYVSKTVFGQYNLVLSILGMLFFLSLPGIDMALTRSVSQGFDRSLLTSRRLKFRLSLVGIPAVLVFAIIYFVTNQPTVGTSLLIAASVFPFLNSFSSYPALLTAKRRFAELAVLSASASIFFLILHTIGILFSGQTVILTSVYLLAIIVPSIVGFKYSERWIRKTSFNDPGLPSYGLFLTVLSALPWISGNIGGVILAFFLGAEALAVYAVASRFLTAVQKNFLVFYKPLTAKLAAQSDKGHLQTLKQHWLKLLGIGVILTSCLWIATPLLIQFFFTSAYTESIRYGQLLSLCLIPLPLTWVVNDMLVYQKRKKPQILMNTVPHILKIGLYFLILPKFGIMGLLVITLVERFFEPTIPLLSLLLHPRKT